MGMLDEAIREHFDLKRRNGADPAVVAIEEREALGDPAQRTAQPVELAGGQEEAATHFEAVTVSAEADGVAVAEVADFEDPTVAIPAAQQDEPPAAAVQEGHSAPAPEEIAEEEIAVEPPEQETRGFTIEESQEAVMPEPPARPVGAPRPAADPSAPAQPEEAQDGKAEEVHDELEETPEFLEETPEHDRLWFERKPPRDFEF